MSISVRGRESVYLKGVFLSQLAPFSSSLSVFGLTFRNPAPDGPSRFLAVARDNLDDGSTEQKNKSLDTGDTENKILSHNR